MATLPSDNGCSAAPARPPMPSPEWLPRAGERVDVRTREVPRVFVVVRKSIIDSEDWSSGERYWVRDLTTI